MPGRTVSELLQSGFVILDKPSGPASRKVVDEIKSLLGIKSAGHVGTLDPKASGVLPILLGRATRIAPALERLDKKYDAVVHLHGDVSDGELQRALGCFVGTISQKPPVHSAVARKVRKRVVYSIDILGRDGKDVRLRIWCEAGTYIRKIASDLGEKIGGAHLKELRRTCAGHFDESAANTMSDLKDAVAEWKSGKDEKLMKIILPVERAVEHRPSIIVKDLAIGKILNGSPVLSGDIVGRDKSFEAGDLVCIMSSKGELIALGRAAVSFCEEPKDADPIARIVRVIAKP